MIENKKELKRILKLERELNHVNNLLLQRLTFADSFRIYNFIRNLRYLEYFSDKRSSLTNQFQYLFYLWNHRRLKQKYSFYIHPNTIDEGLHIVHPGFIRIAVFAQIGKNCTILPRVLIGKKKPGMENSDVLIGNNCYIGTGSTILGPLTIGNNVTIAAGSIVTKDIPDNATVAGVPAKVIAINK
ncbi:serine O-acetyltransferase [Echinicola sp. 20G]|uniref:serine O-acetyltransferase n=1 Tax=Echinicola sp. 20G TaxID=2781961 RepID=UPI0019102670|nr:serine acetyltransferase [Echinicola sp. 20G]